MPAGSSLEETNRVITDVEKILQSTPEVESTSRRTGLQLGLATVTEANTGDISVKLKRKSQPQRRRSDRRGARKDHQAGADARRGVPAAAAGHDRRPHQRARADGDQAILAGSGAAARSGRRRSVRRSRRFPAWWTCSTASRTRSAGRRRLFQVDQAVAARAGFTPQEVELDASAILQGEPAPTPVVVNDRAYTIRVRFPESDALHRSTPSSNTLLVSSTGKTATLGSLATVDEDAGADRDPAREPAARRHGHGTARGPSISAAASRRCRRSSPVCICRRAFASSTAAGYEEQQQSFHDLVFVLALAVVLVFIVLLFEFGSFAAPIAVICVGAALDVRRLPGAADHGHHVQPLVVHGADHGDRHRRQERHPAAGCRPEIPRRRDAGRGKHDSMPANAGCVRS